MATIAVVAPGSLFDVGKIYTTPGALNALERNNTTLAPFLERHRSGDWGDLEDEEKAENNASVKNGSRILSAYRLSDGEKIWIITEAGRLSTTVLLPLSPSEY